MGPGLWGSQLHPIPHLIFSSGDEEPLDALGSWETRPLEAQLAPTGTVDLLMTDEACLVLYNRLFPRPL